jgi:hypothetical protein
MANTPEDDLNAEPGTWDEIEEGEYDGVDYEKQLPLDIREKKKVLLKTCGEIKLVVLYEGKGYGDDPYIAHVGIYCSKDPEFALNGIMMMRAFKQLNRGRLTWENFFRYDGEVEMKKYALKE